MSSTVEEVRVSRRPHTSSAPAAAAFVLAALNLRIAVAALSPVLSDVERAEHLSPTGAGVLTTVPVVCFGAFAFLAPRLTRRFGPHHLLFYALLALIGGITLRLASGPAALFGGTLLVGAAIAVANVLMPQLVKRDFTHHASLMSGLYSVALSGGAAVAAGLTIPLVKATGWGWRPVLGLWALPAVIAAVAWLPQLGAADRRSSRRAGAGVVGAPGLRALLRDRTAWAVTLFMGLQSLGYYALLSWLPTLLKDHGMSDSQAGWMLSFSSLPAIAVSLAVPSLHRRIRPALALPVFAASCCAIGLTGLLIAPVPLAYLWMTALGVGQGLALTLALGYIVARSPDAHHTGQLSTMAQGAGYLIACLGPLGVGLLHSISHGWTVPIVALLVVLAVQTLAAIGASRDRHVLARSASTRP